MHGMERMTQTILTIGRFHVAAPRLDCERQRSLHSLLSFQSFFCHKGCRSGASVAACDMSAESLQATLSSFGSVPELPLRVACACQLDYV